MKNPTYDEIRNRLIGYLWFTAIAWLVALPIGVVPLLAMYCQGLLPKGKEPLILAAPFVCAIFMLGSYSVVVWHTLSNAKARHATARA